MATYEEALKRSLELNKELKGSCKFARPQKDPDHHFNWNVEIIDSKTLLKKHEKDETFRTD